MARRALLLLTLVASTASLQSAAAAGSSPGLQLVVGVITPVLGVSVTAGGLGSSGARDGVTVTTERRGSHTIITIAPAL